MNTETKTPLSRRLAYWLAFCVVAIILCFAIGPVGILASFFIGVILAIVYAPFGAYVLSRGHKPDLPSDLHFTDRRLFVVKGSDQTLSVLYTEIQRLELRVERLTITWARSGFPQPPSAFKLPNRAFETLYAFLTQMPALVGKLGFVDRLDDKASRDPRFQAESQEFHSKILASVGTATSYINPNRPVPKKRTIIFRVFAFIIGICILFEVANSLFIVLTEWVGSFVIVGLLGGVFLSGVLGVLLLRYAVKSEKPKQSP